ncbi:hypothetical protein NZD89_26455 [Alicyclobacillus fastidiosus]|uniref:Core domain-containing protein n=1 Tax=Alicyclobacillus fastidiosus TaxID=392011 RepID=A0ABY6ZG50_9BACL|nr:iron-sulfur cluster biosynthesis family protein [Alicyclobacillus fastidiosus]WAH41710.1 hypothetical protein NZD89_26455 [Alicyclobacillus fastidiosus]GMA63390.1 hypothetical protein GCM10025859_38300 [Alicyclobacillus fastidiosus]
MNITDAAKSELVRFSREELQGGEFIRVTRAYQCGGPRFQLTVDVDQTKMDERITLDGVTILIEKSCLNLMNDVTIDFADEGFVFESATNSPC